jgi:hypothetical protein
VRLCWRCSSWGSRRWRGRSRARPGLHWGNGAGLRLAWGQSFIIAADVAYGREAGLQTYLKLGQMF